MAKQDPYQASGVDYELLDSGKRTAVEAALATSHWLGMRGGAAVDASRGESAFVFEYEGRSFAFVMEGLGTKSVVAQMYYEATGEDRFASVAYDTVAAIVNDLCSVGALPLVTNAYFATGGSEWYADVARSRSLIQGWKAACDTAECTWGGGESPSLVGLLNDGALEIAGTSVGVVPGDARPVLGNDLAPGDAIVLVQSNGLHSNGAALARSVAGRLGEGLLTRLPSGVAFGEALLTPGVIYVPLVARILSSGIRPSYLSHITGHGLLKIMRPRKPFTYRLTALPDVPEVLQFLADHAEMDSKVAYRTLNMGVGYAVYCREQDASSIIDLAEACGYSAMVGGRVEAGSRRVVVEPLDVVYGEAELQFAA